MAIAAIAGLTAVGSAAAVAGTLAIGWTAAITAFAIGAGLSMVSRALMPKPDIGQQLSGTEFTVREPDASRKMIYGRARVGGAIVFLESTGDDNKYIHMVIAVAGHEIDAFEKIYFNEELVWQNGSRLAKWLNNVEINVHLGNQTTADSDLVAASTEWTADHKLLDTAYMYLRLEWDNDLFANGLPNVSALVRGKKVYNPVTTTTAWSQNPALCVYDYILDAKYGLGDVAANVDQSYLATAIALCDEDVALSAGGTQKRYTLDGRIDTLNSKKENIEAMLTSMAGTMSYSGGKYFISGSEYIAPTTTIDESAIVGDITVQTKQSRRSVYNGVKGLFVNEDDNYTTADYPAQLANTDAGSFITGTKYIITFVGDTDFTAIGASSNTVGVIFSATGAGSGTGKASAYGAEDDGIVYLDMPLAFTTNNIRAQRIAKLALLRSRMQTTVTMPCNLAALKFKAGDNIMVTNAKMGWSQKIFQVTGYELSLASSGEIVVNVDAIETASAIYDWQSSDEEDYLEGGEVPLYDGLTAGAPVAPLNITPVTTVNADGTVTPALDVSWTAADDAFTDHYLVQWRNTTDNGQPYNQVTKLTDYSIAPVVPGKAYDVSIFAVNGLSVKSTALSGSATATADTTPKLPSFYQAVTDSASAPTAGQFTTAAGRDPKNGDVFLATDTTTTEDTVHAWTYSTTTSSWSENTNFISGDLVVDGTITGDQIKADTITANKLSGDVSELFPVSMFDDLQLTTTDQQTTAFTLPAPELGISKRARLDLDFMFKLRNTSGTDRKMQINFSLQVKSKSATGIQVGATNGVVAVSFPHTFKQLVYISGNHLAELDNTGGVADNSSGTGYGTIEGVYYDGANDRTYVLVGQATTVFSTGETMFFNAYKFAAVGTWVNPASADVVTVDVPTGGGFYYNRHSVSDTYGAVTTATDFRASMDIATSYTNVTVECEKFIGTMELVS